MKISLDRPKGISSAGAGNKTVPKWFGNLSATHYDVLGVRSRAVLSEIKRAYHLLGHQWHPDVNPGHNQAEAVMTKINEAYEVLSDQENRRAYDLAINLDQNESPQAPVTLAEFAELIRDRQMQPVLDALRSAGLHPDTIGAHRGTNILWAGDGSIYLNLFEVAARSPATWLGRFDYNNQPAGAYIHKAAHLSLGCFGICYDLAQNPADERVAMAVRFTGLRSDPSIIMIFKWSERERNNISNGQLLSCLRRGDFSSEGLFSLPGSEGCLVLRNFDDPVLNWGLDGNHLMIINRGTGKTLSWETGSNSIADSQLNLPKQAMPGILEIPEIAISPGNIFAAVSYYRGLRPAATPYNRADEFVEIIDLSSGEPVAVLENTTALHINWDAEGDLLFLGGFKVPFFGHQIFRWNWRQGSPPELVSKVEGAVGSLKTCHDGTLLAIGRYDGNVEVIDLRNFRKMPVRALVNYGITWEITPTSNPTTGAACLLAWAPGDQFVASGNDMNLIIWGLEPGKLIGGINQDTRDIFARLRSSEKVPTSSLINALFRGREELSFADLDTGTGEFVVNFEIFLKNISGRLPASVLSRSKSMPARHKRGGSMLRSVLRKWQGTMREQVCLMSQKTLSQ
jgi:hypothetical protein